MCTSPTPAWLTKKPDFSGKYQLCTKKPHRLDLHLYDQIEKPCGKCIACIDLKSLRDATQLICELKTTTGDSWFATLTYDDEHLPADMSVSVREIQLFNKKYRKHLKKQNISNKYRYRYRGEYGGQTNRPHYHICMFSVPMDDLVIWRDSHTHKLYRSPVLEKIWGKGQVVVTPLTPENCRYISRHHYAEKVEKGDITKLIHRHPVTGVTLSGLAPEFTQGSNRPGMGQKFFERFKTDIFPHDNIVQNGRLMPVPKYFDKLLQRLDADELEQIKAIRVEKIKPRTAAENNRQAKFNKERVKFYSKNGRTLSRKKRNR